jgi:GAF domain-containing protein
MDPRSTQIVDVLADPDYTLKEDQRLGGHRTLLGVPLRRDGQLIGVIVIGRVVVRPLDEKHVRLIETFADQAVIAIENARLFEEVRARTNELQEALDHQTATSELLRVIGRSNVDLQPVFDALAESAVRLCDAEGSWVHRFDGQFLFAVGSNSRGGTFERHAQQPHSLGRSSAVARAGLERCTIHIPDIRNDPEYTYVPGFADQARTVLAVPMLRGTELQGVIAMFRREVRPFTQSQTALIETFADQAVIAIENARLFEEVKARTGELTESLEYQTAISDVLGLISKSPTNLQPVLNAIITTAVRLCEADNGQILLPVGEGRWKTAAATGFSAEFMAHVANVLVSPGRGTLTGRILMALDTYCRCACRSGLHPEGSTKTRGLPDASWRSSQARWTAHWHHSDQPHHRPAV